jgi:hypothetical protein
MLLRNTQVWRSLRAFRVLWVELRYDPNKISHSNAEILLNYYFDLFKFGVFSSQSVEQFLAESWHEYEQCLWTKLSQNMQLPSIEFRQSISDLKDEIKSIEKRKT